MNISGQPHATAAFSRVKFPKVPFEYKTEGEVHTAMELL